MPVSRIRFWHCTDDGTETGDDDGAVNGSVTPVTLFFQPSLWGLSRVIIHHVSCFIQDNAQFTADNYGGISTLANGIAASHVSGSETTSFTLNDPIKSTAHWAALGAKVELFTFGSGDNFATAVWEFNTNGSYLELEAADELQFVINDDLSTLVKHHFMLHGSVEP